MSPMAMARLHSVATNEEVAQTLLGAWINPSEELIRQQLAHAALNLVRPARLH